MPLPRLLAENVCPDTPLRWLGALGKQLMAPVKAWVSSKSPASTTLAAVWVSHRVSFDHVKISDSVTMALVGLKDTCTRVSPKIVGLLVALKLDGTKEPSHRMPSCVLSLNAGGIRFCIGACLPKWLAAMLPKAPR